LRELAGYATTKAIVSFPAEKELPIVKRMVKASLKAMKG
jgi:predicted DNA repair protein MutK